MWGLLDVPYADARVENIRYNSGFYAMMQFSKYIRKGNYFVNKKIRYACLLEINKLNF